MKNSGSNHEFNRRNSDASNDSQNELKKIHSISVDQISLAKHSGRSKPDASADEKNRPRKNHLSDES